MVDVDQGDRLSSMSTRRQWADQPPSCFKQISFNRLVAGNAPQQYTRPEDRPKQFSVSVLLSPS